MIDEYMQIRITEFVTLVSERELAAFAWLGVPRCRAKVEFDPHPVTCAR